MRRMDEAAFNDQDVPLLNGKMLMIDHIDSISGSDINQFGDVLVQMKGISLIGQVIVQVHPLNRGKQPSK